MDDDVHNFNSELHTFHSSTEGSWSAIKATVSRNTFQIKKQKRTSNIEGDISTLEVPVEKCKDLGETRETIQR